MPRDRIPIFYLYLYAKIYRTFSDKAELSLREVQKVIGMQHNIPKPLRMRILREMSEFSLIRLGHDTVILSENKKAIEFFLDNNILN